ncbi:hypothetical protein D9758_002038 [Tetrapyrgos nigripes]|uniref:DUF6533 domain-containing protein n=1 Tax=Tetrapyrgos nigripes TaxID=182062 RepID=A0A8H5GTV6_9AGAR|nr:hypothetical protein D9758_002038 [Tetrapyrgos nigripes]
MGPDRLVRDLEAGSGSAFFFQLWDTLITLDDEVEFIWPKPATSWIKWSFLIARYFSLATHLCSRAVELSITYGRPLNENAVRIWFGLQALVLIVIFMSAELVIMARVYALYNQERWIGLTFILLLLVELLATVLGVAFNFPSQPFDMNTVVTDTPRSFLYFGISACISETTVLVLSITKYLRSRWMKSRILTLMMRDGTIAFAVLFLMLVMVMAYHLLDLPFSTTAYAYIPISPLSFFLHIIDFVGLRWTITFISVTECRLILNMQQLPVLEQRYTINPEMTSVFRTEDTYEMTVMTDPDQ